MIRSAILSFGVWCAITAPALSAAPQSSISEQPFGVMPEGQAIQLFTLRNSQGMEVKITNYGGIIVSISVPNRNGQFGDVVLGYSRLKDYVKNNPYFGALIGRYGNRIAQGRFELDGKTIQLAKNDPPNSLHGGRRGFDKVAWTAHPVETKAGPALQLNYTSPDGEEGFPGELTVTAVYTLTEKNELRLKYKATTTRPTVINLTNHAYFNLAGAGSCDILGHEVCILADRFTPIDETFIPTGELRSVDATPFDFRKPAAIGARIGDPDQQLKFGKGYDHNWVVRDKPGRYRVMAHVYEPTSGRELTVWSTEPGLQFYSGNFLDGTNVGKDEKAYKFRNAFCMEPQHFPDSPNHPNFPSVVLKPGETYQHTMGYQFSVRTAVSKSQSANKPV